MSNYYQNLEIDILEFIYNRMINIYNENPDYDYMIKFKNIIDEKIENSNNSIYSIYSIY